MPPANKRTKPATGRSAIFRGKVDGVRVQGVITKVPGSVAFEEGRRALGKLAGLDPERISDADTIEFLALGPTRTKKYLESLK